MKSLYTVVTADVVNKQLTNVKQHIIGTKRECLSGCFTLKYGGHVPFTSNFFIIRNFKSTKTYSL